MPAERKHRRKLLALAALAIVHLVVSVLAVTPGHLSVDEGTYHMMVRDRAAGHGFEIRNGYREFPSPELIPATLVESGGRLVAVPPELFTFLALPFYLALGYRGLFLLNALAFLATVALAGRLAWRVSDDPDLGLDTALLLAVGTFLWEYSQAAWPHATAALLVTAAFAALTEAWRSAPGWRRWRWAFVAGLVGGAAVGVRMDSVLALPALVLPFLFVRPPSLAPVLATVAGTAPGLLVLAAINRVKFGVASPLTYGLDKPGGELAEYLPVGAAAAAVLGLAWVASRRPVTDRFAHRLGGQPALSAAVTVSVAVPAVLAAAVSPPLRQAAADAFAGLWQLVVDLRARPEAWQPALARTSEGGMVYVGALKKSLLQSCPYLAALVIPLAGLVSARNDGASRQRSTVLLFVLVPAAYVGFYGALAWHGGLALNLRYFTPALPFLAALAALTWRQLTAPPDTRPGAALLAAAAAVSVAVHLGLRRLLPDLEAVGFVLLDLPLALAALLALTGLGRTIATALGRPLPVLRRCAIVLYVAGVAWAAAVAFTYDYPRHAAHRGRNLELGDRLRPAVPEGSVLFVHTPDPYYSLLEVPALRLAVPPKDGFADFRSLVDGHLDAGRPVLASWPPPVWAGLRDAGLLRGYALQPLLPDGLLMRLRRASPPGGTAPRSAAPPPPR